MKFRSRFELKNSTQLKKMRQAGLVVRRGLDAMAAAVRPGITTREIDQIGRDVLAEAGATSNFLHYGAKWGLPPFPGVACISINDEIVHGFGSDRELCDGDLVSIDFGAIVDGWHGDAAVSVECGQVSDDVHALSEATRRALWAGIAAAQLGGRIGDIEHAIESAIDAEPVEYGIVEEFSGHGIGSKMHMAPDVMNFGDPGRGPKIVAGMVLALEPMITIGNPANKTLDDQWTVVTVDGSVAAHWENTITCTPDGVWVLSELDGGEAELAKLGVPFGPLADES